MSPHDRKISHKKLIYSLISPTFRLEMSLWHLRLTFHEIIYVHASNTFKASMTNFYEDIKSHASSCSHAHIISSTTIESYIPSRLMIMLK